MSWKNSLNIIALSLVSAPAALWAGEPRLIESSPTPPKVVFEKDDQRYDVLDRFRNTRSSEQIHFQAIETLFPRVPERQSIRQGYTMVKELVDAKKAANEAADLLEQERIRLEAARQAYESRQAELESQAAELERQAEEKWEDEPEEFDYYEFDNADVQPQPEPQRTVHRTHNRSPNNHHRTYSKTGVQKHKSRRVARSSGGILGRLFQKR